LAKAGALIQYTAFGAKRTNAVDHSRIQLSNAAFCRMLSENMFDLVRCIALKYLYKNFIDIVI
jgi:hypothetical protein